MVIWMKVTGKALSFSILFVSNKNVLQEYNKEEFNL
jgi:hypothetical protein